MQANKGVLSLEQLKVELKAAQAAGLTAEGAEEQWEVLLERCGFPPGEKSERGMQYLELLVSLLDPLSFVLWGAEKCHSPSMAARP